MLLVKSTVLRNPFEELANRLLHIFEKILHRKSYIKKLVREI